ncbi:DNA topoisomerase 2 [Coemansia sp. RSA 1807]|nr:DNA topoisomerase 2 [Coemansia sp. RSA 921]KAJ2281835.1 DNA topoisomerase 2 [Coemansia sp. RSA 451]KAJ2578595.1 DNA topoisomerase 2 [Coemansia sp. RSA 1807]
MSDFESDGSVFELDRSPVEAKPKAASAKSPKAATAKSPKAPKASTSKRSGPSVEEIYQKKTPIEHVLLRPDTYIGSVEPIEEELWVMNTQTKRMEQRKLRYTPGLYKIVDEILVNAADNKSRDPTMKKIEVTIDQENGVISILNDGQGIPIEVHREQNVYVPELIFGHLLTSSNYNDDQEKTTGGRNGYGAKLCNIFSHEFIVETADANTQKKYHQVFSDNMKHIGKPKITKHATKKEYTKITFKPDFAKFHMTNLDDDAVALITKRVYDLAGCVDGVRVFLNGEVIPLKNFKSYVELYLLPPVNPDDPMPAKAPEIVYKKFNERWEVAFAVSDGQFNQVSFVNSINTLRGGTHVNYIADQISKNFISMSKKSKTPVKPHQVKNNMWLFVNSKIVNPTFDSQTKETLTLRVSAFKSTCEVSDDFMKGVMRSDLKEYVDIMVRRREERELKKTDGTRTSRITGIEKLDDANLAGTRHGKECTLILTEGDSAKTLAVAGLGVQGRDRFGIFALRGKPLNVRDATSTQILANQEFTNIKQILGLKHGAKYASTDQLRYGHVMIMADQDVDGSHIKGLLINMFDSMYPGLLEVKGFLQQFITPVVRVTHKQSKKRIDFYTEVEYKKWYNEQPESAKGWLIKYYKGLGTSKDTDAHEYFRKLEFHRKSFETAQTEDRKLLDMAFSKSKADARKEWLAGYQPGELIDNNKSSVGIEEFINKELVLFSMEDNARSIPSVVDGLKPGQRKILWTALEANLKSEMKVVSLQGKVTEKAMYHHGDQSLVATIVNMAQDFVGSNNINLLMPEGSFGTRLAGGKDAASARYIATYLNKITRTIFNKNDDPLLDSLNDDGKMVEPRWYMPVIPMVLVNGAEGIGTGWSTTIPNYSPSDIIDNIRRLMRQEPLQPMNPWYRGFRGSIEQGEPGRFRTTGSIEKLSDTELHISELPIRVWTDTYKTLLNKWMAGDKGGPSIRDFRYNSSTLTVDITLTLTAEQMAAAESTGLDKHFKLTSTIPTTNMVCFDREGRLRRFQSAEEIIDDFYPLRLRYYQLRKENMAEKLGRDLQMADNRARFVMEIIQKKLTVNNRKRLEIIQELRDRGYAAMAKPKPNEADADAEPASDYDYLLSMPIWNLTMEKVEKLLKEKRDIEIKLEELLALTPIDLWNVDLDEVERMWNTMVDEYEERLADDEVNRKGQGAGRGKGKTVKRVVKRKPDVKSEVKPLGEPVPKVRKVGAGSAIKASVTPKQSVVTTPTAVQTPATMGSDLDDSDEDVATMIFKKAAMKKQGAVKQTTLGSMLAQKAESGVVKPSVKPVVKPVVKPLVKTAAKPTAVTKSAAVTKPATAAKPATITKPAAKPAAKRGPRKAISDSEDDDDGFVESDSDDLAPPPPRQTAGRRAAATKTPVYMDVSDDSDDGDFK